MENINQKSKNDASLAHFLSLVEEKKAEIFRLKNDLEIANCMILNYEKENTKLVEIMADLQQEIAFQQALNLELIIAKL